MNAYAPSLEQIMYLTLRRSSCDSCVFGSNVEFLGTILQDEDDRLRRRPASAGPQDDRLRRRPASVTAFSFRSFSFFQGFSVELYRYFQARKAPPRIAPRSLSYTSQVTQSVLCLLMVCFCAVVTLTIDLGPQANL